MLQYYDFTGTLILFILAIKFSIRYYNYTEVLFLSQDREFRIYVSERPNFTRYFYTYINFAHMSRDGAIFER